MQTTGPNDYVERLVPLETWVHENRRNLSIWMHGSPHLTSPAGMGKWLKRNESRLTQCGVVVRLGTAWRIVEPAFKQVMFSILTEERDKSLRRRSKT